ncbi:MAG: rod shape-determining protein MreC, partial [Alistipes sp.]|nr:rod shape-determining protein MreC [Alistipes sp.]
NYIIIGKGEADGVEKGDGVVTGNGAIGVIDAVSEHFSYARSFQNHGMSISARLGPTGTSGQLVWDGIRSNGAFLNEIPHHVEISVGDTIYTSGFSSIFPPDIPLGVTGKSRVVNGSPAAGRPSMPHKSRTRSLCTSIPPTQVSWVWPCVPCRAMQVSRY